MNSVIRYIISLVLVLVVAGGGWVYYLNQRNDIPSFTVMSKPLPSVDLVSIGNPGYELPDRPFLLLIWATWCPTCVAEHDYLMQVAQDIPIVGITLRDEEDRVVHFLNQRGNPFLHNFSDSTGSYADMLGSTGTPTVYFIDSHKMIRGRVLGGLNKMKWQDKQLNQFAFALD